MVALESVAGSAPDMDDSGGDAWTPEKNIPHKKNRLSNHENLGERKEEACGISCSNEVGNGGDNVGEGQIWG
eukprot:9726907-Heterocapsa_arctica.AAC.1